MKEQKRMQRAFDFFTPIMKLMLRVRFGYRCDSLRGIEGPYLLLCNHNMELDPVMLGVAGGKAVRFVASEHIARKGFGTWFLMRYFHPILHVKGKSGQGTSLKILRALKSGDCVAMFPEGNRSFNGVTGPMLGQLGRLARRCGASLVTYRIEGGYFTQPRWGTTLRRGRLVGHLVNVYTPQQMKEMTDDQVEAMIANDLREDAYASQEKTPSFYKGKHMALGLESALYWCPYCHGFNTLHSDDNGLRCDCGYRAEYTATGHLRAEDGKLTTITRWDEQQQQALREQVAIGGTEKLFEDSITVREIREDHTASEPHETLLSAYPGHLQLGDEMIFREKLAGAAVFSRNVLTLLTDKQYEVRGQMPFNALKYRHWAEIKQ